KVLARDAAGEGMSFSREEQDRLDSRAKDLGLWGVDAPQEFGGGQPPRPPPGGGGGGGGEKAPFIRPPPGVRPPRPAPWRREEKQTERYLAPYARGEMKSAIAISEPGGGGDPAAMKTRAVKERGGWLINGRKIWISGVDKADFTIVMAVTDPEKRARGGISAFILDKRTPGFNTPRTIPIMGTR